MVKHVNNRVTGGTISGTVIQAGGKVTVTGDVAGRRGRSGPDVGASAREIRALLDAHPGPVPDRLMTGLTLDHLAGAADDGDAGTVGQLWAEVGPRLSELAGTMAGLAAMEPHIAAITDSLS